MLMSDKYSRRWSDAEQYARRLIRDYDISSADDLTCTEQTFIKRRRNVRASLIVIEKK